MDSRSKTTFSNLFSKCGDYFQEVIEKITTSKELSQNDKTFLLCLSIIFFNESMENHNHDFLKFSYYLVLKYSLLTGDMEPLYTFATNNGLYPISKAILKNRTAKDLDDSLIEDELENYKINGDVYQLKRQFDAQKALIDTDARTKSYIAPTSYGKSTFILDDIEKHKDDKIGIIVPKKALIWQTFKRIKGLARKMGYRVLIHDDAYDNDERMICVFTQERASRLLSEENVSFDALYIDEAHNLFSDDQRSVLLARLIRMNEKLNPSQRVIFLSPLVADSKNLMVLKGKTCEEQRIDFNIKELVVRIYKDNSVSFYDRFTNQFFKTDEVIDSWQHYLSKYSGKKNLIFLTSPKKIEEFVNELLDSVNSGKIVLDDVSSNAEINKIVDQLATYVHKDYLQVKLLKYGVIYIHGRTPDAIKDYLMEKFASIDALKYIVSNTAILEGVNLPIDSLFVFNWHGLSTNDLINLCGRVNRLNEVFKDDANLNRLLCDVHFVKSSFSGEYSPENAAQKLRVGISDTVNNPLLPSSNSNEKNAAIAEAEESLIGNIESTQLSIADVLTKNGMRAFYKDFGKAVSQIEQKIQCIGTNKDDLIELSYRLFIADHGDNFQDLEVRRLNREETRIFYRDYVKQYRKLDLRSKVLYFKKRMDAGKPAQFYFGPSFGEVGYKSANYSGSFRAYVDVTKKSDTQKVNLAIIKAKLEDDFVSFNLGKMVESLKDLRLISDDDYNSFFYGTQNPERIKLLRSGISITLLKYLEDKKVVDKLKYENTGISASEEVYAALEGADDFIMFEFKKLFD